MPDPVRASEAAWLPFMRQQLGADAGAIVVGHSSGAIAAMRLAETDRVAGVLGVGAGAAGDTSVAPAWTRMDARRLQELCTPLLHPSCDAAADWLGWANAGVRTEPSAGLPRHVQQRMQAQMLQVLMLHVCSR